MQMTSLIDYTPLPGELVEFRVPIPVRESAAAAPAHPVPPGHLQENHLRRRLANTRAGHPQAPWLGIHFDLPGRLDTGAMAAALTTWVRRHTTLLTWFAPAGEGFRRHAVAPETAAFVPEPAGTYDTGEAIRDRLRARLVPETDPLHWPPLAACAVLRPTSTTIVLAIDHAHTDGLSMQYLFSELRACYTAELAGTDAELPEVGSYVDFCRLDRERAARIDASAPEVARWTDFLRAGLPAGPVDLGTEPGRMHPSAALTLDVFDAAGSDAFARTCKAAGAGYYAGVLAALGIGGHRLGGPAYHRALTVVHTRDEPRWERAHGWFINTVPVEFPVAGREFADVATAARAAVVRGRELGAVTPMRLLELVPDPRALQADATQTLPLVSYMDLRHAPGSREWADSDVGFLFGEGRAGGLNLWVNRLWDRTYLRIEYPDTPAARDGVRHFAATVRQVMREAAGCEPAAQPMSTTRAQPGGASGT
ncbi:condensation domain protein [Actinobacteria bacterium OK074]|nr:condensation domain protein [Actinobacteria bacterium OK074]